MKKNNILFWTATGLVSFLMVMSAGMYLLNNAAVQETFTGLGFPTWIIYPFAFAKLLGVATLINNGLTGKYNKLTEWAYAGFAYDFMLAFGAHTAVSDGQNILPIVALVMLGVSYYFRMQRQG